MSVVAAARVLPMRQCSSPGRCSAARSIRSIAAIGAWRWRTCRPRFLSGPRRSATRSRRDMFSHFGRLLVVAAQVQHDAAREQMLARVEFEGEDRVRPGARAAPRRAALHRAFRLLGNQRAGPCADAAADGGAGAAARQPAAARSARIGPHGDRQSVIYRRGAIRRVLRALEANQAVAVPDRSAHAAGRRRLRGLLQSPGGDDVGAGRAGAADRRAGRPGVRAAAARRTLPDGLRARGRAAARQTTRTRSASSPSAAPTCSRCTCAGIRSCGCGCIAAGGTCPRASRSAACFRRQLDARDRATTRRTHSRGNVGRSCAARARRDRLVIRAPNWLGDAVMALPAHGARSDRIPGQHDRHRGDRARSRRYSRSRPRLRRTKSWSSPTKTANRRSAAGRSTRRCCCRTPFDRPGSRAARASRSAGAIAGGFRGSLLTRAWRVRAGASTSPCTTRQLVRGARHSTSPDALPRITVAPETTRACRGAARRSGVTPATARGIRAGRRLRSCEALAAGSCRRSGRAALRERGARACSSARAADRDAGREIESSLPARRPRRQSDRPDRSAAAGRRPGAVRRVRLERFGRDAPGGGGRRAGDRDLRPDRRARDRAARRS